MTAAVAEIEPMCLMPRVITGLQCKMARVGLGLGVRDLAAKAGVGPSTITRIEAAAGVPSVNAKTLLKVKEALEDLGAEFAPDGSVRIRT
jgi:hypothetical protein